MDGRRVKFLFLGAGILATMVFLLAVGIRSTDGFAYYMTVSEFLRDRPDASAGGLRINGKVAQGTIERLPSGQDVRFVMTEGGAELPVRYHGIIPDTFVDGADVVVEGTLGADGTLQASTLLAKCPSKYEAAEEAGEKHPEGASSDDI